MKHCRDHFGWLCYSELSTQVCAINNESTRLSLKIQRHLQLLNRKDHIGNSNDTCYKLKRYAASTLRVLQMFTPDPATLCFALRGIGGIHIAQNNPLFRYISPERNFIEGSTKSCIDLYNKEERGIKIKSASDAARFMV